MAVVHFVNYKRGIQSRAAMRGVMLYVMQEKKTAWEDGPLISGINCQPQSVYDDFLNTKLLYHKDGGVMFYHMVQSFPKGAAVDPRQAHEAARRLAEYFDGCELLVCTHVDREHIHSHFLINSVNFDTGRKLAYRKGAAPGTAASQRHGLQGVFTSCVSTKGTKAENKDYDHR